jgi:PKD repeat protein
LWSTGATTASINVTSTTTATVTTTNLNACDGVGLSQGVTVTFTASPTANGAFTSNGNVVSFTNTSTGASAYSWDFGDQSNSSAATPSHAYVGNGVYTVTLTAINGNCTDVVSFDVTISVGIDELTGLSNVTIYPNPANDFLNIDYNKNGDDVVEISIIDQFGRVINSINGLSNGFNHKAINVSNLQSGVYYVRFTTNGFSKSERVVIR